MNFAPARVKTDAATAAASPFRTIVVMGGSGAGLALDVMREAGLATLAAADCESACRALREGAAMAIISASSLDGGAARQMRQALAEAPNAIAVLIVGGDEQQADDTAAKLHDALHGLRVIALRQPLPALDVLIAARAAMCMHDERARMTEAHREHDRVAASLPGSNDDAAARMLDESRAILWIAAADGGGRFFNRRWLSFAGRSLEESLGDGWTAAVDPEDVARIREVMFTASRPEAACELDVRMRRADGQFRTMRQRLAPITNDSGSHAGWLSLLLDVTDYTRAEADLLALSAVGDRFSHSRAEDAGAVEPRADETHRTAAIATLSAGLGHDLGNMVFPLRIHLDMMEAKGLPAKFRDDLSSIRQAAEHLQRLATGLRHLAMDPDETGVGAESTDLHEWWMSTVPVLKNALSRGILLEHDVPSGLPNAAVAAHALTQAAFNLVQNAGEALQRYHAAEDGKGAASGTVRISAEAGADRRSVILRIADDGPGMSEEIRRRCLEPFFTTKTRRLSTGLGLPLVRGIMERAEGRIDIESEPGRGTVWTLTFPAAPPRQSHGDASAESAGVERRAIVSLSDARLRAFVVTVLQSMEFEVASEEAPTNGEAAVARLWITEPSGNVRQRAEAFVSTDERRRVVVFGALPEGGSHPRIIETGETSPTASIRRVLRSIVGKGA
jgi:PAS domain S-box-containing protein